MLTHDINMILKDIVPMYVVKIITLLALVIGLAIAYYDGNKKFDLKYLFKCWIYSLSVALMFIAFILVMTFEYNSEIAIIKSADRVVEYIYEKTTTEEREKFITMQEFNSSSGIVVADAIDSYFNEKDFKALREHMYSIFGSDREFILVINKAITKMRQMAKDENSLQVLKKGD